MNELRLLDERPAGKQGMNVKSTRVVVELRRFWSGWCRELARGFEHTADRGEPCGQREERNAQPNHVDARATGCLSVTTDSKDVTPKGRSCGDEPENHDQREQNYRWNRYTLVRLE